MNRSLYRRRLIGTLAVSISASFIVATLSASDEPPAKQSSGKSNVAVPADDLAGELRGIVARLDGLLAKPDDYDEARQSRIAKEADVAAVVALALTLDEQDHRLKRSAASAIAASQSLAKAPDYAAAKRALDELKATGDGKPATVALALPKQWTPVAPLGLLMKEVPQVNNRLKRAVQGEHFKSQAKTSAAASAALAAIAEEAATDHDAVKKPADVPKWKQLCAEMRDAAGRVNQAIHAGDADRTEQAMAQLAQSCEHCHRAFRK
jgi:cytochrome c556